MSRVDNVQRDSSEPDSNSLHTKGTAEENTDRKSLLQEKGKT